MDNPSETILAERRPRVWQFSLSQALWGLVWLAAIAAAARYGLVAAGLMAAVSIGLLFSYWPRMISAFAGVALLVLLSLVDGAREEARRSARAGRIFYVAFALQNYHDVHGSFPPAYIADASGRPMHSWRVLLLPYMERMDLYQRYDFNEPWNGPNNRQLASAIGGIYGEDSGENTRFVAVVGPETAWPGSQARTLGEFPDGTENTILLVEVLDSGIHWMEPRDLTLAELAHGVNVSASKGISSPHRDGANVAFADGRYRFLSKTLSWSTLRALLTADGKEKVNRDAL